MTTEQQIQERAKACAEAMRAHCKENRLDDTWLIFDNVIYFIADTLTAQQTADEAANREGLERLTREQGVLVEAMAKAVLRIASAEQQRDTARAESAQLSEVLGKLASASQDLVDHQNGCPLPKYEKYWTKAMADVAEALALAATVLKEGNV